MLNPAIDEETQESLNYTQQNRQEENHDITLAADQHTAPRRATESHLCHYPCVTHNI